MRNDEARMTFFPTSTMIMPWDEEVVTQATRSGTRKTASSSTGNVSRRPTRPTITSSNQKREKSKKKARYSYYNN
jgi:hypothetical protein